jgi:hypothetical protein
MRLRHAFAILVTTLVVGGLFHARPVGAQASGAPAGETGARSTAAPTDLQAISSPRGGSLEQERDPGVGPRVHEPVFIEPGATTTKHTRFGLSSWIAPGAPFDHRENPGGAAIGLTIGWPAPTPYTPSSGASAWRGSAAR